MINILLVIIIFLLLIPSSVGFLVLFHVFVRGKKAPADTSNRINHLRLIWFALNREDLFADLFPWLKNDEFENVHGSDEVSVTRRRKNCYVCKGTGSRGLHDCPECCGDGWIYETEGRR